MYATMLGFQGSVCLDVDGVESLLQAVGASRDRQAALTWDARWSASFEIPAKEFRFDSRAFEEGAQTGDRVALPPRLDLSMWPIPCRVIRRTVPSHSIGDGLDEGRTATVSDALGRGLRHGVDCEHVVPVDDVGVEPEARGTGGEG